jgi:serine/threonine protein kinase
MIVSVNNKYYTIQSKIGAGSYSKVYKAIDSETGTIVAIKIIITSKLNASLIQRLSKEIEILNNLKHSNIIALLNYSITDKHIYLVMDFCNGGTVGDKIGKLTTEAQVKEVVKQIIDGMLYLQNKNILHRDIKPANILFTTENIVKIIDFGFSSDLKDSDMYSTICGTPMYMSPELLKCESYNKKTDLWSLGVITYELIHHKNPFGNPRNISQLLESIKKKNFYYKSSISPECLNFITSLLQETPDLRPDLYDLSKHEWFSVKDIPSLYDSQSDEDPLFAMDDIVKAPKKSESPSKLETILIESGTKEEKIHTSNINTISKPIDIIKNVKIIENFFPLATKAQTIDPSTLHRYQSSPFTPSPIYKILKFSGDMIKNIFDYKSNNTY